MGVSTSETRSASASPAGTRNLRWRVVDIVVASVVGVAAGLVFLLWNIAYRGPSALLEPLLPGLQGLLDGPWLFAGVLGALIIRKPGAAIYTEVVAAAVSALTLIGNTWGAFLTLEAGLIQGLGAEIVFLLFFYRRWSLPVAILAGVGAALAGRGEQPAALVRRRRRVVRRRLPRQHVDLGRAHRRCAVVAARSRARPDGRARPIRVGARSPRPRLA